MKKYQEYSNEAINAIFKKFDKIKLQPELDEQLQSQTHEVLNNDFKNLGSQSLYDEKYDEKIFDFLDHIDVYMKTLQ